MRVRIQQHHDDIYVVETGINNGGVLELYMSVVLINAKRRELIRY